MINLTYVTPEYFDALRIPIVRGRVFSGADSDASAKVIVVNQAFVRRYSKDQDPLRPLDDVRAEAVAMQRVEAVVLGALSALALLLSAVGIYGLVAGGVVERTRELGIRIALGATPMQTVRAAALPGVWLSAVGVLIGLVLARGGAGLMRRLVFGVPVTDPLTFGLAAGLVLSAAATAALMPSLKILRLNVIAALRRS